MLYNLAYLNVWTRFQSKGHIYTLHDYTDWNAEAEIICPESEVLTVHIHTIGLVITRPFTAGDLF
jgi:hypothetical protein